MKDDGQILTINQFKQLVGCENPRGSLRSPDNSYRPFFPHLLKQIPDKMVLLFVV